MDIEEYFFFFMGGSAGLPDGDGRDIQTVFIAMAYEDDTEPDPEMAFVEDD